MNEKKLKVINILVWGGIGLLIAGIAVSYSAFAPYFDSLKTAGSAPVVARPPVITVVVTATPAPDNTPALLPFEGESLPASPGELTDAQPLTTTTFLTRPHPLEAAQQVITYTLAEAGSVPVRILIPDIDLDAPIVSIGWKNVNIGGVAQPIWDVPEWRAAGWHKTSAKIGVPGNTVLNGHNTSKGEVFRYLYKLDVDAQISIEAEDDKTYKYVVAEKLILQEAGQPIEVRIQNAQYILPTGDERLTLVTCHPYGSLAKRLIIIAYPVGVIDTMSTGGE